MSLWICKRQLLHKYNTLRRGLRQCDEDLCQAKWAGTDGSHNEWSKIDWELKLAWDVNWLWFLGWCLPAPGSCSLPWAFLYHFASPLCPIYCTLCFNISWVCLLSPSFHVLCVFLASFLYLEGIWNVRNRDGQACDTLSTLKPPLTHIFKGLGQSCESCNTNETTMLICMNRHNERKSSKFTIYNEQLTWHCTDITCLAFSSIIHLLK